MKGNIRWIFLVVVTIMVTVVNGQTDMLFQNGKQITATWIGETEDAIQVRLNDSEEVVIIQKSQLIRVFHPDGEMKNYLEPKKNYSKKYLLNYADTTSSYQMGQRYAQLNYKGDTRLGIGTGVVSLIIVMPYAGLAMAGIIQFSPLRTKSCMYEVPREYANNEDFVLGYAYKRKQKRVRAAWLGWGCGTSLIGGILLVALSGIGR